MSERINLYKDIPLISDMINTFSHANYNEQVVMEKISEHFGNKTLRIYELLNLDLSPNELREYIKFLDFTSASTHQFKLVGIFITKDNIKQLEDLFQNCNIRENLLKILSYDVVTSLSNFETVEEEWISYNFEWVIINSIEMLTKYMVFQSYYKYYLLLGKIYNNINNIYHRKYTINCDNVHNDLVKLLGSSNIKNEDVVLKIILSIFEKVNPVETQTYIEEVFINSITRPNIFNHMLTLNIDIHVKNKALVKCCEKGKFDLVKQLVELGTDVHTEDESPLYVSCKKGYLNIVEYLISNGANVNGRKGDIFYEAVKDSLYMVQLFIENGVDVNLCRRAPLAEPCIKGDFKIVNYLIGCGINTNIFFSNRITYYIGNNNLLLFRYLVENGKNNYESLNSVIVMAILHDNMDTIKHLIENNIVSVKENGLFMLACKKGNPEVVSYLIEKGAVITEEKESTILKCIEYRYRYDSTIEGREGVLETIKILIKNGANVCHSDNLPLSISIKNSYYEVCIMLIENGADMYVNNDDILTKVIRNNEMFMLKFLVDKCKKIEYLNLALRIASNYLNKDIITYISNEKNKLRVLSN